MTTPLAARPGFLDGLDEGLRDSLRRSIRDLWSHHSTALEGNSLTLGDTQFVLSEGLTVSGKPLKDHNEVHGHARAIELIYAMLDKDALAEDDLFLLHKAIITERVVDIYKPIGAWKAEANYTNFVSRAGKPGLREYPAPQATPRLMRQWFDKCNSAKPSTRDEVCRNYAELHILLVSIHPFFDGNGRMARLVANIPVLKAGYPPIVVPTEDRQRYLETISAYQESIANLAGLKDLVDLPAPETFTALCADYWSETMQLVETARQMRNGNGVPPAPTFPLPRS
ncbi:MAG: Fic family protein [Sulfurisoma sp.]|nr:Fic family protein [Sulfurisoma sp.]